MRQKFAITNTFELTFPLRTLLTTLRYQRVSYIPDSVLFMFREFCTLLFYLDLRDKFSLTLRKFSKHTIQSQNLDYNRTKSAQLDNSSVNLCLRIINYGNLMLSYRCFLKQQQFEIQDIVVSSIGRLGRLRERSMELERRLAECVEKRWTDGESEELIYDAESFDLKLAKLLDEWKEAEYDTLTMGDVYEHSALNAVKAERQRVLSIYGEGEEVLVRIHDKNGSRTQPYLCGSFEFERFEGCAEFLELFFKLAFDQTEDWETLGNSNDQTPLLPEFFDEIRAQELPNDEIVDRQHIMSPGDDNEHAEIDSSLPGYRRRRVLGNSQKYTQKQNWTCDKFGNQDPTEKQDIFKAHPSNNVDSEESEIKKEEDHDDIESELQKALLIKEHKKHYLSDQPLKVLDFGPKYAETTNLAIWLIKWASRFQKILMSHKSVPSFWLGSTNPTIKLCSINANFLVSCVYLADNNHLEYSATNIVIAKPLQQRRQANNNKIMISEDEFTQVSSPVNAETRRVAFQQQKGCLFCKRLLLNSSIGSPRSLNMYYSVQGFYGTNIS